MDTSHLIATPNTCSDCGTQIAATLVACPGCSRLVHSERLKALAESAEAAERAGDWTEALAHWRQALELLPPTSRQFDVIREKAVGLSRQIDDMPPAARAALDRANTLPDSSAAEQPSADARASKSLAAIAVAVLLFVLTKGKLLIAGLLKGGTFLSMLMSVGVYWTAFGWKFAVGIVVSIYVHEMGHVAMLRRYGIRAGAPMFIPSLGDFIRLKQHLATPSEDARVGLAGPMWGLAAAVGAGTVSLLAGWPSWAAIAHVGAWLNLFNLMPIWQLDGGRAFNAMTQSQRAAATLALALAWLWIQDGLLMLIAIVAAGRTFSTGAPRRPDRRAMIEFIFLVAALSVVMKFPGFTNSMSAPIDDAQLATLTKCSAIFSNPV
jgi:Zn-dependent protease